jgi:hypothetical protein
MACSEGAPFGPTSSAPLSGGTTGPPPQEPVQPRYTVTGDVRDSRGAPVAGAEIWIYGNDSPIDNRYGVTYTDSDGRYSVSSETRVPHAVRAMKDGYVRSDVPIVASASPDMWRADITIAHIDRYTLLVPAGMAVGEWVRLQAQIDLDDGSTSTGFHFMELSSSNGAVLHVEPTGWINGLSAGTATVSARYYGAPASASVRVSRTQ